MGTELELGSYAVEVSRIGLPESDSSTGEFDVTSQTYTPGADVSRSGTQERLVEPIVGKDARHSAVVASLSASLHRKLHRVAVSDLKRKNEGVQDDRRLPIVHQITSSDLSSNAAGSQWRWRTC